MYEVVKAFNEAYQINGNWYQDYVVKDGTGALSIKRYMYQNDNWVLGPQDTIQPIGEAVNKGQEWEQQYSVTNGVTNAVINQIYRHNGQYWYPVNVSTQQPISQNNNIDSATAANEQKKINLMKKVKDEKVAIDLKKRVVNLDKCIVDLSKKSGINLGGHRARVAICLDYSGSMRPLYRSGAVQQTLTRIIPIGLQFDDNGEVDVWLFHGGYKRIDEGMSVENFSSYVNNIVDKSGERYGSTSYAPVLRDVYRKYVTEEPNQMPAFVIFLTDGANDDKRNTDDIVRKTSEANIFIQFIGQDESRHERFTYLRKLDDLTGRNIDNTGFFDVANLNDLSDEELYNKLLEQYITWLSDAKKLGIIK